MPCLENSALVVQFVASVMQPFIIVASMLGFPDLMISFQYCAKGRGAYFMATRVVAGFRLSMFSSTT